MSSPQTDPEPVSTGRLPPFARVRALVGEAHARFRDNAEGASAAHYLALAEVPPDLFGVAVVAVDGQTAAAGAADHPFTIMSVAKPFVLALVCQALGSEAVRAAVGVNATGLPFDSATAIEKGAGATNPMVNAGAIATTALVPGDSGEAKWVAIQNGLSRFAGRPLAVNEAVLASARATNHQNRALAFLLERHGRLAFDALETVDLYTRQSALEVSAGDLATMAATLATAASTRAPASAWSAPTPAAGCWR
jgi:glutaminase